MNSTPPPIQLDLAAAFDYERGLGRAGFLQSAPQLESARENVLTAKANELAWAHPWRAKSLLEDYKRQRRTSLLWRVLQTSARLRDEIDRLVMVGSPAVIAAGRALFAACCHPYHNELTRGERGGRPRIYFVPARPDNDALQGLFDLLPQQQTLHHVEDRWGVLGLDDSCGEPLIGELFTLFCDGIQSTTSELELKQAICMGYADSPAMTIAESMQCQRWVLNEWDDPPDPAAFGPFEHPGLFLAGSMMGIDLVQYLRGCAAMMEHFQSSPVGDNPPLDLAGLRYLLHLRQQISGCDIASGLSALEPLAECFSPAGDSDRRLVLQLDVKSVRRDRVCVTMPKGKTASRRNRNVSQTLADMATKNLADDRQCRIAAGLPTAVVQMPTIDEYAIGQLTQMLTLAGILEKSLTTSDS